MADEKKGVEVELEFGKPRGEAGAGDDKSPASEPDLGKRAASDAAFAAMKAGDKDAWAQALESFVRQCKGYEDDDTDEG